MFYTYYDMLTIHQAVLEMKRRHPDVEWLAEAEAEARRQRDEAFAKLP